MSSNLGEQITKSVDSERARLNRVPGGAARGGRVRPSSFLRGVR